jgi:transcriptional regulator with XRE-family HTH domain
MPSVYQRSREQAAASGERLTALLRERGVSPAALAASVQMQRSTLDNYCAGGPAIPSDVIERIAAELNTTVAYLMTASDNPRSSSASPER